MFQFQFLCCCPGQKSQRYEQRISSTRRSGFETKTDQQQEKYQPQFDLNSNSKQPSNRNSNKQSSLNNNSRTKQFLSGNEDIQDEILLHTPESVSRANKNLINYGQSSIPQQNESIQSQINQYEEIEIPDENSDAKEEDLIQYALEEEFQDIFSEHCSNSGKKQRLDKEKSNETKNNSLSLKNSQTQKIKQISGKNLNIEKYLQTTNQITFIHEVQNNSFFSGSSNQKLSLAARQEILRSKQTEKHLKKFQKELVEQKDQSKHKRDKNIVTQDQKLYFTSSNQRDNKQKPMKKHKTKNGYKFYIEESNQKSLQNKYILNQLEGLEQQSDRFEIAQNQNESNSAEEISSNSKQNKRKTTVNHQYDSIFQYFLSCTNSIIMARKVHLSIEIAYLINFQYKDKDLYFHDK